MNRVKELRIKNCMSQADLAKKAGVTISTIVSMEKNKHYPNFVTLRKVANALYVDPIELGFLNE
jgi:DNA-binding XRE family transcriptional regulator